VKQITPEMFCFRQGGAKRFRDVSVKQAPGQGQTMKQQFQVSGWSISPWRGGQGERLWLSTLVETMEQVAQRAEPCDGPTLAALRAQLALPPPTLFAQPIKLWN
jgi:hypothetical protein